MPSYNYTILLSVHEDYILSTLAGRIYNTPATFTSAMFLYFTLI